MWQASEILNSYNRYFTIAIAFIVKYRTHRQDGGFQVEIDGVHDDEHLLVLVSKTIGFPQRSLAEVLDPPVLAQERGREAERQPELEGKTVNSRGQ